VPDELLEHRSQVPLAEDQHAVGESVLAVSTKSTEDQIQQA